MKEYIQALHHVGLPTACMDETVAFYRALGADVLFEKTVTEDGRAVRVTLLRLAGVVIECYERTETAKREGAVDHLAFSVNRIEEMYQACKAKGYRLMEDCAQHIGISGYWPHSIRWFIVYGPNGEKIEFCQE